MSRTILFLTDFSKCAQHALQFLIPIAKQMEAHVKVAHGIGSPAMGMSEKTALNIFEKLEEEKKKLDVHLTEVTSILGEQDLESSVKIVQGALAPALSDYIAELKPDLIVMGTVGNNDLGNTLMGSLAFKVTSGSSCPVLVIPQKAQYQQFEQFTYATNFMPGDLQNLLFLLELVESGSATVDIVHVTTTDVLEAPQQDQLNQLKERLEQADPGIDVTSTLLSHQKVTQGILDLIEEKRPHVLALASAKRNFWEQLVNESLTKKMIERADIPMLVFTSISN